MIEPSDRERFVSRILLLHSGVYGHTRKICEHIRATLAASGVAVDVAPITEPGIDPAGYDGIFIGASIRNGKHNPAVLEFIRGHLGVLESKPGGFFSVSLVARKPGKDTALTNPYKKAFMEKCPWKPDLVTVFGGDLDYQRYGAFDRNVIRFIMWITKGPTDPSTRADYTDWGAVERFAERMGALVRERAAA